MNRAKRWRDGKMESFRGEGGMYGVANARRVIPIDD